MSTISALKHIVRRLIEHKIDIKDLETILDTPMPLVVASLTLQDVQKILSLTLVVDNEFDFVAAAPIPPDLSMLAWIVQGNQLNSARTPGWKNSTALMAPVAMKPSSAAS